MKNVFSSCHLRCLALGVLALACLGSGFLAAEDYTIIQTQTIPPVYYVGDTVELRLGLRTAFAQTMVAPKVLVQPAWGNIRDLVLIEGDDEPEVRLFFTCYQAGTHTLPSLNFGPVVLEGINIHVSSLLEGVTNPSESRSLALRDQLIIPWTVPKILLQGLVCVLVPVALAFGLIRGRKFLFRRLEKRRSRLPYRRLSKSLHAMEAQMETLDARSFYIRLLQETRLYLSDRLRIPAFSTTTEDLKKELEGLVHHQETTETLVGIFRHGDRVKFAFEPASVPARIKDLHALESILRHLEQEAYFRGLAAGSKDGEHVDA